MAYRRPEKLHVSPVSIPAVALFPIAQSMEGDRVLLSSRRSMQTVSSQIESAILTGRIRSRLFAGFQKMSFFLPRVKMFQRIAATADGIWVFAIPDVPPPVIPGLTYVALDELHPLAREWFMVVNAHNYWSALVAEDQSGFAVRQAERIFRALWTFSPDVVSRLQRELSHAVALPPQPPLADEARDSKSQFDLMVRSTGQLVERLEAQNRHLTEVQDARETLSRMLVHDLRNPLTSVLGSLQILAQDNGALAHDRRQRLTRNAARSAQTLNAMITEVLDVAKLQANRVVLQPKPVPPVSLLLDAIERARSVGEAQGKQVSMSGADGLPDVLAERDKIERVLDNLISNALKYTASGGRVTLSARPVDGAVEFSVADDGPGIPSEALDRIFEPFGQAGGAGQRSGTGLGLTFCRLYVEAHGGTIRVESEMGRGTVFRFSLPAA